MDYISYECAAAITAAPRIITSLLNRFLGGFDVLLQTLIVFMVIDFISGWLVAATLKCAGKTSTECCAAGFRGLLKKGCSLLVIVVAVYLDLLLGTSGITRDTIILAFVISELLSIAENMRKMGIKMPYPIANILDMLNRQDK